LIVAPLNFVLVTLVVIVMTGSWTGLEGLLVLKLDGVLIFVWLLSPSEVPFKVLILVLKKFSFAVEMLVEALWYVADGIEVVRADLSDVHVDHQRVPCVDLEHLFAVLTVHVDVVVGVDVLVGSDGRWLAVNVARGVHIEESHVGVLLLFIDAEEEVRL